MECHFCNRRTWVEAKVVCERNNSRLVIPCNREYSDMVATLASLYEINRANSWIGFKSTRSGWESKEISDYKAIESGHCTGSALNWYKPEQEHVTECLQNYAGESDAFQLMIDTSECDLVHWFVCEKEGGCDTV
ncbi:lectin C-type domain protein [Dictyocaulus viviparus]|uniref:Lectin C-type domain protein n=1 Tax=Dictyocaulus viviparus TaxID=29172 RepID=A0A0D8XJK0_DICVI|nr:lectin C-type domain protein [Dictyocaulus viviparus]